MPEKEEQSFPSVTSSSSECSSRKDDDAPITTSAISLTSNPYNGSKLFRYVMDYLNEVKTKPKDLVLECEEVSMQVLDNENGFKYVMRKMDGKEELEEAFFIEYLEKYCHGKICFNFKFHFAFIILRYLNYLLIFLSLLKTILLIGHNYC